MSSFDIRNRVTGERRSVTVPAGGIVHTGPDEVIVGVGADIPPEHRASVGDFLSRHQLAPGVGVREVEDLAQRSATWPAPTWPIPLDGLPRETFPFMSGAVAPPEAHIEPNAARWQELYPSRDDIWQKALDRDVLANERQADALERIATAEERRNDALEEATDLHRQQIELGRQSAAREARAFELIEARAVAESPNADVHAGPEPGPEPIRLFAVLRDPATSPLTWVNQVKRTYDDIDAAHAEAQRLVQKHGGRFMVLEARGYLEADAPTWHDGAPRFELPF